MVKMAKKTEPKQPVVAAQPTVFKYALVVVSLSIILKTGLYALKLNDSLVGNYTILLVLLFLLIGLYFGIENHRKTAWQNNQVFKVGDGFKTGARMVFLITTFYSLFIWFYYSTIDVTFFERMINERVAEGIKQGIAKEELDKYRESAKIFLSPQTQSFFTFIGLLIGGIVYAYLISWMTVKKYSKKA